MATKPKKVICNTPVGVALYPWLTKPDTKHNVEGVYSVNLTFDSEDSAWAVFLEKANKVLEAYKAELQETLKPGDYKKVEFVTPGTHIEDEDGNETGRMKINCKQNAVIHNKKDGTTAYPKVALWNTDGTPFDVEQIIYSGSKLKVNVEINPYYMPSTKKAGISFRLRQVLVVELSQGSSGNAFGIQKAPKEIVEEDSAFGATEENNDF
jgi:hypothetical protein